MFKISGETQTGLCEIAQLRCAWVAMLIPVFFRYVCFSFAIFRPFLRFELLRFAFFLVATIVTDYSLLLLGNKRINDWSKEEL